VSSEFLEDRTEILYDWGLRIYRSSKTEAETKLCLCFRKVLICSTDNYKPTGFCEQELINWLDIVGTNEIALARSVGGSLAAFVPNDGFSTVVVAVSICSECRSDSTGEAVGFGFLVFVNEFICQNRRCFRPVLARQKGVGTASVRPRSYFPPQSLKRR
jgi:hypothetical protein